MTEGRSRIAGAPTLGRLLLATGAALAVLVLAVLAQDVIRKINSLATATADNLQWNLSQVEVEFLRFEKAVEEAAEHGGSPADVRRRFNVLYSRVGSLGSADAYAAARDTPEFAQTLARINAFLESYVTLIDSGDDILRTGLPDLAEQAETLHPHVRVLALKGMSVFARLSDLRRTAVAETLALAAGLALALVVVLLFGLGILFQIYQKSQRRAREVQAATARFRAMVSTSLDAILVIDDDGIVLDFNGAAETLFGYRREEVVGKRMSDFIIPEHLRSAHEAGMKRYRETGEKRVAGGGQLELEAVRRSGEVFPVEVSIDSARSDDGVIFIAYLRDISERKANEDALLKARDEALAGEKAKAELIAVMSHEMRTPLNGLLGTLDVLKGTQLDERQTKYVRIMEGSGRNLLHHVNDVLDVSRLDSGKVEVVQDAFDLTELVQEVIDSQKAVATKGNNRLHLAGMPRNIRLVRGDSARLRQILLNLIGNALKFTRDGDVTVDVSRGAAPHEIIFNISDTGVGIAESELGRVFDDFVTIDTTYGRESEGTGLGLAIVRRLASVLGGEVGVESEVGEGSVFWVSLPLPAVDDGAGEVTPHETGVEADVAVSDGSSVLLVEDNEVNRFVAREMLEKLGYRVTEANDGQEGVLRAADTFYDLILMDISMPRMDGLTATRMIRSGGASRRSRIIALTAHALPQEIERFRAAGMDGPLIKPITQAALRSAIAGSSGEGDDAREEAPPLDPGAFLELQRALGPEKTAHFAEVFIAETDEMFATTVEERVAGDIETYRAAVHKVAGSAAVLGASGLNAHLARLEGLLKQGAMAEVPEAHAKAAASWRIARSELRELVRERSAALD